MPLVALLPARPEELPVSAPTPAVFIIGAGVVGTALGAHLVRRGVPVLGLHDQDPAAARRAGALAGVVATSGELPELMQLADAIVVAVQDDRLADVARVLAARRLGPRQVVLQTSGARPAAVALAPAAAAGAAGLGTLHPLAAFASVSAARSRLERGCVFAVEGDQAARRTATALAAALPAPAVAVEPGAMALYHAGAVFASNYLVVLAGIGRELLVRAGFSPEQALPALLPLIESTVENLAVIGLPAALTGPVSRGDVEPVRRHIQALAGVDPGVLDLYRRLGTEALKLARERGRIAPEAARTLESLLRGSA